MAKKKTQKQQKPLSKKTTPEVRGLITLSFSLLLLLSLISFAEGHDLENLLGLTGFSLGFLLNSLLGISAYIIPPFLAWYALKQLLNKEIQNLPLKIVYIAVFIISTSMLLSVLEVEKPLIANTLSEFFYPSHKHLRNNYHLGGAPFFFLYHDMPGLSLEKALNWVGVTTIFMSTWLASLLFLTQFSPLKALENLKTAFSSLKPALAEGNIIEDEPTPQPLQEKKEKEVPPKQSEAARYLKMRLPEEELKEPNFHTDLPDSIPEPPSIRKKLSSKKESASLEAVEEKDALNSLGSAFSGYKLPPLSLLTNAKKTDLSHLKQHLKRGAEILEETLQSFGIEAKVGQINCGPTITSYEVHPSVGVKVQKIKTLENDIALNMQAQSIRIIAPIPGKAAVGIEVPNKEAQEVGFKEMLQAYQQGAQKFRIPILLGKTVHGDWVMSDLTKFPHCIIAGATGSGKSVCINTIVMSILTNCSPDEVKLLMVDPKKVELTPYTKLPHMLAPVITEPHDACAALNWLVKEMEKRYEILKITGARNIDSFNNRKINEELEASSAVAIPKRLPYFVGIIDELADLMMVSASDIETPIARIAQMARAVGIHLILATQRPSREVITGLIKANFPTRISFKVASRVNSQIVLDDNGAEALLGNGDMLFLPPGTSHLTRAQGAYIRDDDISATVKFITDQSPPQYIIQSFKSAEFAFSGSEKDEEPEDTLYPEALDIILSTNNASTTFLQRKLKVGYARAASLIDQLEARGIVGPAEGAKPRKILAGKKSNTEKNSPEDFED